VRPARRRTLLAAALGTLAAPLLAQTDSASVERLRAAFTINFARYTTWPAAQPGEPLRLCVAASATQFEAFADAENLLVQGRPLRVVRLLRERSAADCDLLYVGASQGADAMPLLRTAAERPTLTIGDAPGFLAQGGIIRLFPGERQMRFDIGLAQAARARLVLAPQLLRLASRVETGSP
jgi:hypothetical protein